MLKKHRCYFNRIQMGNFLHSRGEFGNTCNKNKRIKKKLLNSVNCLQLMYKLPNFTASKAACSSASVLFKHHNTLLSVGRSGISQCDYLWLSWIQDYVVDCKKNLSLNNPGTFLIPTAHLNISLPHLQSNATFCFSRKKVFNSFFLQSAEWIKKLAFAYSLLLSQSAKISLWSFIHMIKSVYHQTAHSTSQYMSSPSLKLATLRMSHVGEQQCCFLSVISAIIVGLKIRHVGNYVVIIGWP